MSIPAADVGVVVNFYAANGLSKRLWQEKLHPRFKQHFGNSAIICETQCPNDGTSIANRLIKQGVKRLAVVGGDGTLREVVQGYMNAEGLKQNVSLHIFPTGTGNDFHAHIHPQCKSLEMCFQCFSDNHVELQDVGLVKYKSKDQMHDEQQYFVNFAAVGVSAMTIKRMSEDGKPKWIPRRLLYGLNGFIESTKYKHQSITVTFSGEIPTDYGRQKILLWQNKHKKTLTSSEMNAPIQMDVYELAIGNGSRYGGGIKIAPFAKSSDQLLDITAIHGGNTWNFLQDYSSVVKGDFYHKRDFYFNFKFNEEVLLSPTLNHTNYPIQLDGEYVGVLPAKVSIVPNAIPFILYRHST